MPALPGNNTAVLYVDYTVGTFTHTMQFRFNASGSASDAMAAADAFLTALSAGLVTLNITGARVRDAGGSVSYPVTWTGASSYGSGGANPDNSAYFFDFVGRSLDGRRCRVSVFGNSAAADNTQHDFRLNASASATIANAIAALEADPNTPCSISGDTVNWHQYANVGTNAYWRNHIR